MEYSNFKIHIELPNGTKQIVWELTEEGDISTNKKKEQEYYANCARRGLIPKSII